MINRGEINVNRVNANKSNFTSLVAREKAELFFESGTAFIKLPLVTTNSVVAEVFFA